MSREVSSLYPYEILVIVDPRPTDEEVAALLSSCRRTLKTLGAEVGKAESWGKRRLAYDMRKQREGTYAVLECSAEPATIKEFERQLRLNEQVLRFLTTRVPVQKRVRSAPKPAARGRGGGRLMASLNKVFLIGNLTRPPELRYTPSGTAVADLRLAVNRNYTTQGGEKREETCFLTVVVWGKQAESCGEYLDKGSPIMVEGRLQTRDWETKDGQKRNVVEVVAERVQFMGREQVAPRAAAPAAPEAGRGRRRRRRRRGAVLDDESVPFQGGGASHSASKQARQAAPVRPAQGLQVLHGQGAAWSTTRTSAGSKSFVSERGKITPRRISGSCARHQRQLTRAIRRARTVALLAQTSTDGRRSRPMKIILLDDVPALGRRGEVRDVSDGYARNYLLPQKLALHATAANLKNLEQHQGAPGRAGGQAQGRRAGAGPGHRGAALRPAPAGLRRGRALRLGGHAPTSPPSSSQHGVEVERRRIAARRAHQERSASSRVPVRLHPDVTAQLKVSVTRE